jgi:hypothetical protein
MVKLRDLEARMVNIGTGSAPRSKDPKMPQPQAFDGSRGTPADAFIMQVDIYFDAQPSTYDTDTKKTAYVSGLLTSKAALWYRQYKEKPDLDAHVDPVTGHTTRVLASWNVFKLRFKAAFADPHKQHNAEVKFFSATQKGSVMDYAHFFRGICIDAEIDLSSTVAKERFFAGLKDEIKNWFTAINRKVLDFDKLVEAADAIETRLKENKGSSNRTITYAKTATTTAPATSSSAPRPHETPSSRQPSIPMDLSATVNARPRLTIEERNKRASNKECFYCGKSGHFARECTSKPAPRPATVSATTTAPAPSSSSVPRPRSPPLHAHITESEAGKD